MIFFTADQIARIRAGRKTMTRRPVRRGPQGSIRPHPGELGEPLPVALERGEPAIARIIPTAATREPLGAIEERPDHVLAEGFTSLHAFARAWLQLWDPDPMMRWAAQDETKISDDNALEHLRDRHAHKPVWVITFEYLPDPPLLLSARAPHAHTAATHHDLDELGYVHSPGSALPMEPEAIDPALIASLPQTIQARRRYERERQQREAATRTLPVEQQLAALRTDERSALIRDDLRVIERRIAAAWKKLGRAA